MTVKAERLIATCNVDRVVQGEALTLVVEVFDEVSGQAFDLADLDTAEALFEGTPDPDGTPITVSANGATNDDPGRLEVELSEANTAALKVGDGKSWQLVITLNDGTIRIVQLLEQLDVVASLF